MSDYFLGEIRMFAGGFAPKGWAFCNGQILSIQQNVALFSLLGVQYGGNGQTNFALPNLQGRAPMGAGSAPGIGNLTCGQSGGVENVTLLTTEIPAHTHAWPAISTPGSAGAEKVGVLANEPATYVPGSANAILDPTTIGVAGGSAPHSNMMPFLTVNFIIALQGIFPPRQ